MGSSLPPGSALPPPFIPAPPPNGQSYPATSPGPTGAPGLPPYCFVINILAAALNALKLPPQLQISDVLPHIHLTLGVEGNTVLLKTLYDTGAGLNLGRRSYHEAIHQQCPHLVVAFVDFTKDNFDPLSIGGIDGQRWGPSVTACITYLLPYVIQGHATTVTFGLAEETVCNTLIGTPFMEKARMTHAAAENIVSSAVFNQVFTVHMERPSKTDAPPRHQPGQEAAVLATPTQL